MTANRSAPIDCGRDPVEAAMWLARAFAAGRRLRVRAPGAVDHAHHVAVEFVHPVVAGTRPLAAAVAPPDAAADVAADTTLVIGAPGDVAGPAAAADLFISSDQADLSIVRSYHVLWELVQVALEHPGLVGSAAAAGGDSTGFLYPFLDAAAGDETSLRESLRASAGAKVQESERLAQESLASNRGVLEQAGAAIGRAARSGGRVLTMGNGGSATDAARLARMLRSRGVGAESLSADYAVATALANDLGADRIFARQLDAFARPGDVLVGCSTSGASRNLLAAFDQAADMGLVTVGLSGYGGGIFEGHESVHHSIVVQSMSVHRIQEAQAALMSALSERIAGALAAAGQASEAAR